MIIAVYVRVSTDKQEAENQLLQLRDYADKNHYSIYREYIDVISGKENSRPSYDQMFKDAHKKLFNLVLFWDLSRFSRAGTLFTLTKLKEYVTMYKTTGTCLTQEEIEQLEKGI